MKFRDGVCSRCNLDVVAGATNFVIPTADEIPTWGNDVLVVEVTWML